MASGLVNRYALVSGKPLVEVEKVWRAIKREFTDSGRKHQYDGCVKKLRERLGLKVQEGREAYLHGVAAVEVLAETHEYACVQVKEIELIEDSALRQILLTSKGIITVPFEHLSHKAGGARLTEMTTSVAVGTGSSVGSSTTIAQPATPASALPPATIPTATTDGLDGIVIYQGRKAVIVSRDNNRARIRFLDTKEEVEVPNTNELKADSTAQESIAKIWQSLEPSLSKKNKCFVLEAILKLEYQIAYLPDQLREDVQQMTQRVAAGTPTKNVETDPEKPGYAPKDDEKTRKEFRFDDDDWRLIFDFRSQAEEEADDEREPLPEPPEEPSPDEEGTGEREGEPANQNIEPASDKEVHSMLKHMQSARENFQLGVRGSFSDRKKINIIAEAERSGRPKSVMEKNLERAEHWSTLLDE